MMEVGWFWEGVGSHAIESPVTPLSSDSKKLFSKLEKRKRLNLTLLIRPKSQALYPFGLFAICSSDFVTSAQSLFILPLRSNDLNTRAIKGSVDYFW
jgi:hypothetical protein